MCVLAWLVCWLTSSTHRISVGGVGASEGLPPSPLPFSSPALFFSSLLSVKNSPSQSLKADWEEPELPHTRELML